MCNLTASRVSVALAYTDGQQWVSEGWWNLKPTDCDTLLSGALAAQFYYVYAMDERGGEWKGKAFMCTSDREFKIEGRQDCYLRGYDRTGFLRDRHRQGRQELDRPAYRPHQPLTPWRQPQRSCNACPDATAASRSSPRSGPASVERETVAELFEAGADVFRINMSHASHDMMRERVALIRSLEEEFDRPIGILVDLQGPKLRVGTFANGAEDLRKGDVFTLDCDSTPGTARRVFLPHPEILGSLQPGHRVLIDDGKVLLRVQEVVHWPRRLRGRGRRQDFQQEGRQPARHDDPDLGDDAEGSRRSRRRARRERRLDRAFVRAAPGGRGRGQEDRRAGAPRCSPRSRSRRRWRGSRRSSKSPTR